GARGADGARIGRTGVSGVEARTLEADAHGAEDLLQVALAFGADGEGGVAEVLMDIKGVTTAFACVGVDGHSRPFFDSSIIVHAEPSRAHRSEICTALSTWEHARVGTDSPKARSGSLVGAPPILIQCPLIQCPLNVSNAVRVYSSAVEGVEAVFGHGRRDAQIPVLGDQTGQVELPGEADSDHARTAFQRGDPVRAEGAIVETAAVAQAGAVGTEAQGGNEDEVEADLRREQLRGTEQLGVLMRLPDAPSALRLQAR